MKKHTLFSVMNFCRNENKISQLLIHKLNQEPFMKSVNSLKEADFEVIIFDNIDTLSELCEYLKEITQSASVPIIVSGLLKHNLLSSESWQLLNAGASDVITSKDVSKQYSKIMAKFRRWKVVQNILHSPTIKSFLIGDSPNWMNLLHQIIEVACYTEAPILIQGESGTGKELIARLIHLVYNLYRNSYDEKELVLVDCTTVVPELSGSEFFGHEKGAFTNAIAKKEGAFELANQGTLFLDEIGELHKPLQAELLRVIQEGIFKPVGSTKWQKTKFRLLCATNRNLKEEVEKENFRMDLYYRVSAFTFNLPPLRERKSDIPMLVSYFLKEYLPNFNIPEVESSVMKYLLSREYPGNIRELRHLITRIACRYAGEGPITIGDIPFDELPVYGRDRIWEGPDWELSIQKALNSGISLKEIKKKAGEVAINLVIQDEDGNLQQAARRLGVSDRTLQIHTASQKKVENRKSRTSFSQ